MSFNSSVKLTNIARVIAALGGVGVGVAAFYLAFAGQHAEKFRDAMMQSAPWVLYALPAVGITIITLLRKKFFLGTEGTGIPQTIAALEMETEEERGKMLSLRILLGKLFLTTLGLFSGASMGREGPTVHSGACLMYFCRKLAIFPTHFLQRGLILAGGAAGIAAAFNAPIAGIVFSFEEINRSFDKRNLGVIVIVTLVACLVCIATFGNYWFYGKVDLKLHEWPVWIFVPAIGIIMGGLGGLFSLFIVKAYPIVSSCITKRPVLTPMSIGLCIGFLGWLTHGQSLGTGFVEAQEMLIHGEKMSWYYPLVRVLATALTLLSGIPGGLFDPTLSAGACFGQWFSSVTNHIEWASGISPQLMMMVAMACFFAGVVQSPITAVVIMVEMTGCVHATLPMLGGAIIAYTASRKICRCSIYVALASSYFKDNRGLELRRED
jgi:H+/Cl- antiporter ClcA